MFKELICNLLALLCTFHFYAQSQQQKIVAHQKGNTIFNIAQQVEGFEKRKKTFTIGVIGEPLTRKALEKIAITKPIKSKKVIVEELTLISDAYLYDLVYLNKNSFSSNLPRFINSVNYQPTLVISEGYPFSETMIGLTPYENSYIISLNIDRLNDYKFSPSNHLMETSIKSSQKLKDFFQLQQVVRDRQKEILETQKEDLTNQKKSLEQVIEKKDQILTKNRRSLKSLKRQALTNAQLYEQKLLDVEQLERDLQTQTALFKKNKEELEENRKEIELQSKFLDNQKNMITAQKKILSDQQVQLMNQRNVNLLLTGLVILAIFVIAYIFYLNDSRRKLVKRLKEKNIQIARDSRTLKRQNKEFESFAYIASHDLQEPLHTITSFSDFMYEDYYDKLDDDAKENLTYIKEGCQRMSALINSLLDYSRIGSKRQLHQINPQVLVNNVIKDFSAKIGATQTSIVLGSFPDFIYGYPTALRMLFQNLISNAIKFKKPDVTPKIYIEGQRLEPNETFMEVWQFIVKDNGIGIAEEHKHKVFEIFQRLHTREEYEGTGIGLAHCKKIVDLHHGDIWVDSTLGEGTTFNFTVQFNLEEYDNIVSAST